MSHLGKIRYSENREKIKFQTRSYYERNKEKCLAEMRRRYISNPKKFYEKSKLWKKLNPEKVRGYVKKCSKKRIAKQKSLVFEAYGGKCSCPPCGELNLKFLTVDHINGGGKKHVREVARGRLYAWLIKNNFPKDEFRLLCWNCNCGRNHNGGTCPHMEAV